MSPVLSIILILAAATAGFFIGRWHGLSTGSKELTNELESKDKELNDLKQGVNQHFDETARLFSNLTEEYKTLYQHLATGATTLSDKDFTLKLSAPVGADALSGDSANTDEAKSSDVIDAEENLAKSRITKDNTGSTHEEESFVNPSSPNKKVPEIDGDPDGAQVNTLKPGESDDETTAPDITQPEIDIEVTPPKDWAEDDIDDDYHPKTEVPSATEFSDLAAETAKKPQAPGFEPTTEKSQTLDEENKQSQEAKS